VRVVDARASMTFEWSIAGNDSFLDSPPALAGCIATMHGNIDSLVPTPPCPVK
jgi:hypothetical protein